MTPPIHESPEFLLGAIHTSVKNIEATLGDFKKTKEDHESRIGSLEQSRFKSNFVVATVAATVGFVFSNLKDGIEWLTKIHPHNP